MADLLRVSILGAMPGGEEWSINPSFAGLPGAMTSNPSDLNAIVVAINAITVPTGFRQAFNNATSITGCRVEARTYAGGLEGLAEGSRGTPILGTGTAPHPFQTAAVISLRTNGVGASGRGRMYIPATGIALTASSLRPDSTTVGQVLTGARQYLTAIEAAITSVTIDAPLVVWSRKLSAVRDVNRVLMGDVLDTQRRRRDQEVESYTQLTYPT